MSSPPVQPPSFTPENKRLLWITIGVSMLLTGIPMAFSPGRTPFLLGVLFFSFGVTFIARGMRPGFFTRVTAAQLTLIVPTPETHAESWRVWTCIVLTIGFLAVSGTVLFQRYAPKETNIAIILQDSLRQLSAFTRSSVASERKPPDRQPTPQPTARPQLLQELPSYGNLGDRAGSLARDIMQDLCEHGWRSGMCPAHVTMFQQMPRTPAEITSWTRSRSNYFRFRFAHRVKDLRNEFAQLHLHDDRLDDFVDQFLQQSDTVAANPLPLLPQQIEDVASRLKVLVAQTRNRKKSRALKFWVSPSQSQDGRFANKISVTITPDSILAGGYVLVEFNRDLASASTDLISSSLVESLDMEANKPLKEYLSSLPPTRTYALALKSPLVRGQAFHVFAEATAPIDVKEVTWLDE